MGINKQYYKNRKIIVKGYPLQVTTGLTVYHDTNRGFVKLDSLYNSKLGHLAVILPNDKTVIIVATKKGLKVK